MYHILRHKRFKKRAEKTFRRYHELKDQLIKALDGLQSGPGSGHTPMRHIADLESQGNIYRMRVGNHRMIYRVYEQKRQIVPLFLSERPRNEATYRDWEIHAMEISADYDDYENQQDDNFQLWEGSW